MTVVDLAERRGQRAPPGPPSNADAEQALLGCILFDNSAFERLPDGFAATDFHDPFHGRLFAAMATAIHKGQLAEPITLMEQFRRDPAFEEIGGLRFLADLVDRAPPASHAADYARVIHDLAIRRELIRIGGDISTQAAQDTDTVPRAMIEQAEAALYSIAETGRASSGDVTFAEALTGAVAMAAEAYSRPGGLSGLSTGLIDVDKLLGGLHPSDLIILAARPSMGKSALATNIAFNVAKNYVFEPQPDGSRKTVSGGIVEFFQLEMSAEQLGMRLLAEVSGTPSDRVRRGDINALEFGQIRDAALEIQDAPLFIDDTGGLPIAQLCARARRRKRLAGLDLIVVDYLQLVTGSGSSSYQANRTQEVGEISQALKALAKELSVPVLACAQLSRQVESREDKKPRLADLRESGSIEQDADVVMFLYREAYYLSRSEPREGTAEHIAWQDEMEACKHKADLIVGKQRHGPIGTVKLHFNENLTKFGSVAREGFGRPDGYRDLGGGDR